MNIKQLLDETLKATNGEISRGLKNQVTILNAFKDNDLEEKLKVLNQSNISAFNYYGMRILEFHINDIKEVLSENTEKIDSYRNNPQEFVRDLRKKEIKILGSSLEYDMMGGM